MKKLSSVVLAGLAAGLLYWPAQAAEADRTEDTVLVTAGRIAEKSKTITQATTVISREEIEKNQHKTLEDILKQNGVQVTRAGGADTTMVPQIALRGMRSSQSDPNSGNVMVLIDGRRTASINIAMLPLVSIERVEILRGPAAVQYGTSAMGGVVNVITKRGGDTTQAMVELGGGSWETWKGMAGVSGKVENFDYAFGFSSSTRNGNWKDGAGNTIRNSDYNSMTSYSANVGYTFFEEHRIGLSLIGADYDRLGDWGGTYAWDGSGYRYSPHGATPSAWSDRKNYALDINYEGGVKDYGLSWMLRYSNAQEDYLYRDGTYRNTNKAKNQGTQAQLSWKYDFLTLTGGVDWSEAKYTADGFNGECDLDNLGAFLLAKTAFLDDTLVFSLGARYDHYNLGFKETDMDANHTSLSAGAAWTPLEWLTFRANIGEAYRMPTGLEIAGYSSYYSNYNFIGNPGLDPEKGLGWDVGFDVEYGGFKAGLTYFYTDYEDKIVTRYVQNGFQQYYNVPGTTRFRGLEGRLSYDIAQGFDWPFMLRPYLTFTHMFKNEDERGQDITYVRDWTAGFGVNLSHPEWGLDVDLCFTWMGDQKETDYTNYPNIITTSGGVTADLTVIKKLYEWEDYGKISLKGELRNLFDKYYALNNTYPQPGRSFFVSLIWQY